MTGIFDEKYKPTIGADFRTKEVEDTKFLLQIWDTAGQERFRSLAAPFYRGSHACVLVYDITDSNTFAAIDYWRDEFLHHRNVDDPDTFPFLLVGNKSDLMGQRRVAHKDAAIYAKENNMIFFETSAKTGENFEKPLGSIARAAIGITVNANSRVIDILSVDLGLKFFAFHQATCPALVLDESSNILKIEDRTYHDEDEIKQQDGDQVNVAEKSLRLISDYIFVIRYGDDEDTSKNKEFHFEKSSEFNIPLEFRGDESDVLPFEVMVKPVDGSLDFIRIKSMMKRHHHFESGNPLRITKSFDIPLVDRQRADNGDFTIHCSSDVVIEHDVVVKSSDLVSKADGGDLRIICDRTFSNNGTVCCNGLGDGGDIYIVAESFVNDGKVESIPSGRFHIFCRKFVNNGAVSPQVIVTVSHQKDTALVSYFLYQCHRQSITRLNSTSFFKEIGLKFNREWIPVVLSNQLWIKHSKVVLNMLSELGIPFFVLMKLLSESLIIGNLDSAVLQIDDDSKNIDLSSYVFSVGLGTTPNCETFTFDRAAQLSIPCGNLTGPISHSLSFTIFCKSADDSFDFIPIHSMFLPQYSFSMSDPLVITKSLNFPHSKSIHSLNGKLAIKCTSDITIAPTATVAANGDELSSHGGEIRMASSGLITNKGTLLCNGLNGGRGGEIFILADSVVNDGKISCEPAGDIYIFCRKFVNYGLLTSDVTVAVDLVDLTAEDEDIISNGGHRSRGPSLSFPSQFRGHARRVSSGILDILKKIDAEPECSICMNDLNKGDAMGQLECGHAFHKQCVVAWLEGNSSCPRCTKDMAR